MPLLTPQEIANTLDDVRLWKPGASVVANLTSFSFCIQLGADGDKAKNRYRKFVNDFKQDSDKAEAQYEGFRPYAFRHNVQYLKNAKKEVQTIEKGKVQALECSSFAYSAIALLMLNDDIRAQYDILQVGTMYKSGSYTHNLVILVPKGKGAEVKSDFLPEGSLIVDPWARSLGQPAVVSLGVSPDNFIFRLSLHPLVVNYNTANDENLEETVRNFKLENPNFEQQRAEAFAKIEIMGDEKPKASPLSSLNVHASQVEAAVVPDKDKKDKSVIEPASSSSTLKFS
jgi:hypothetical protein